MFCEFSPNNSPNPLKMPLDFQNKMGFPKLIWIMFIMNFIFIYDYMDGV